MARALILVMPPSRAATDSSFVDLDDGDLDALVSTQEGAR
jgi:hypothetical protein